MGKGPKDLKRLIEVSASKSTPYMTHETKVEGNKIIVVTDSSDCPMVEVAKAVGLPLRTLCENMAFPYAKAVARTVNPNIKHTKKSYRRRDGYAKSRSSKPLTPFLLEPKLRGAELYKLAS